MSSSEPTTGTPTERVAAAYARIATLARPEIWITLRPEDEAQAEAAVVEQRLARGETLPLAGLLVAVKDNVDVAGLPTTAGCPDFAYVPTRSATAVERLVAAGAIVVGKTNMDQFATGLVGTRSPYGAVGSAADPTLIGGGSSSGSAVAVALGIVDVAVGTDTAGSGRVPAAFNGVVGIKPTLGLVPTTGVVPACADFDAVTVFARELAAASEAIGLMIGDDGLDPRARPWALDTPLAAPSDPVVAVPRAQDLSALSPAYRDAFAATVERLERQGVRTAAVDISPLLEVALLLYDGAIVAERYAAVGTFLEGQPASADPTVTQIVLGARDVPAHRLVGDLGRLAEARRYARALFAEHDALLLPTTTEHPTVDAVAADPVGINRRLGTYTNFCNLADLAAVAVPGDPIGTSPFGVTFVVPAHGDQVAIDLAARLTDSDPGPAVADIGVALAVFGAHLRGQPLCGQLEQLGARFGEPVATSRAYRLVVLDTDPAKPGLVRVGSGGGAAIAGELWHLSPHGLGSLLAALPAPMSLTPVDLADGRRVVGFGCSLDAAQGADDITAHGGWRAYLAHRKGSDPSSG